MSAPGTPDKDGLRAICRMAAAVATVTVVVLLVRGREPWGNVHSRTPAEGRKAAAPSDPSSWRREQGFPSLFARCPGVPFRRTLSKVMLGLQQAQRKRYSVYISGTSSFSLSFKSQDLLNKNPCNRSGSWSRFRATRGLQSRCNFHRASCSRPRFSWNRYPTQSAAVLEILARF